jgi:Na+-driven multidrug efflux pump
MREKRFCESKFRSMLLTGTFTMAVIYIMLLCDNIIAGYFIGESGVAAINAVTPVTGIVTFFSTVISIGSGILYSRQIGAMNKRRADEIYGQGLILSAAIAVMGALLLILFRDIYFKANGIRGEIYELALVYYRWTPLNAVLNVMVSYLSQMVYTDGDETCNNVCYACQIGGNILFSVLLASRFGMLGIILGTIIGNALGLLASLWHFLRKSNTLHFVWHLSASDLVQCVRFSIVDAAIYLCWAVMDYVLIGHVSANYGETGQVTLAVVISLIEFGVVMDGVGLAVQPLLGTYLGENNHVMIRRLMHAAIKAALAEGLIANLLVFLLARQFCGLFGISDALTLTPSVRAVRIVSLGMVFCSAISLMTSYYMLIDHVGLSVGITFLKDGLLYSLLPVLGSVLFAQTGMWAAFAVAPLLALALSLLYIRFRYGREQFPYLLEDKQRPILVFDDVLTRESCVSLSEQVNKALRSRGFGDRSATQAALFTEEIGLTLIEKNKTARKPLLVEISLLFDESSVLLIERDSGAIFDVTDPELKIDGLSSFVINGLLNAQKEKAYLTTTGYNRNMIRFSC